MTYRVDNLQEYFSRPDHTSRHDPYKQGHLIHAFRDRYQLWVFNYAKLLASAEGRENAGFAILSLLNAYIDVVGRFEGDFPHFPYKDENGKVLGNTECIDAGLKAIFPELNAQENAKVVKLLRDGLRNSVAHLGLTGENIALDAEEYQKPFVYDFDKSGEAQVIINPIHWYLHLKRHFDQFVESLLEVSEPETDLQRRFHERNKDLEKVGKKRTAAK